MTRISMAESSRPKSEAPLPPSERDLVVIVDRSIDPRVVMYQDPQSAIAEQYRTFRTNLVALNPESAPRALLVTSAIKGEGKSVTAANLAVALVELSETRVLLVDADLRAPRVHTLFGQHSSPGLSDLLLEGLSLDQVVVPTQIHNLSILPAGREVNNPSELIGSPRIGHLISTLKAEYQYLLFDTPPVLPFTDACQIGTKVDGAIVVVRMEKTPKDQIDRALRTLEAARTNVIGSFLAGCRDQDDGGRDYVVEDD